jgi:hypothetical protein
MRQTINVARAIELRDSGMSWRLIGVQLAIEDDRELPYLQNSVKQAVHDHRRKRKWLGNL